MAAVTTFVSRRPHPLEALRFGVRWALGHSLALMLAGGALILLGVTLPAGAVRGLEAAVGVMLLGLGLWVLASLGHIRLFDGAHRRAHAERRPHSHVHRYARGTLLVGMAHGLAGTAAFLALLPVALLSSRWLAGAYLVSFGVGTIAAMGLYAMLAGIVFHRVGNRAPRLESGLRAFAGLASAAIGILWIVQAV